MRGVLFFFFVVLVLLLPSLSTDVINTLSPVESLTISSNRTIVSRGDVFELGFFKTTASSRDGDRWYLGIWYKKISERVYIWVANRDNPLSNSIGTLKISNGNLVLLDHSNISIWSTNLTEPVRSPVMAELLANGNFVLRDFKTNDPDGFLWQSFDFPTDTLLPEMKMGWDLKTGHNRFLRSWKSPYDPSSGDLWYKLEPRGLSEFFLWKRDVRVHRSGPWDGTRFSGIPEMQQWNNVDIVYNFTESREEVAYTFRVTDHNIYSRLTMSSSGRLEYSTLIPTDEGWNIFWVSSTDQCDMYEYCGPYSYCDMNTSPMCKCIKGFEPRDSKEWDLGDETSGCVRKTQLNCKGEDFVRLSKMKLPDTTTAIVDRRIGLKECQEKCLQNCNCTAFANTDIRNGGTGCVIWVGKLVDIRNYADGGQDLYVKLAASDLGNEKNTRRKIIGWIVGVIAVLFLSFIIFYCWKRKQKLARPITSLFVNQEKNQDLLLNGMVISSGRHLSGEDEAENIELPLMGFEAVAMATDNFSDSNKLGQGGFGTVYKGRLFNGQEIAVKRLSEMSHQGTHEFKNEVKLISKLQHINLVRILGCCVDAKEKMIIYEYLENSSLDHYLFDKTRSRELNWQRRFNITNGIARGILYLHQDSRCRIVHRDLKASNVLLDKEMIPKISDFGMARIFGRDEEEAVTRRIVGTYGYMSPEYAMEGIFSVKSDVYSFGVLVLEIISGKQNRRYYNSNHDITLVSWAWRNWNEGKGLEIIDPIILDPSSSSVPTFLPQEALRCIQIGLLCVQERVEDRPMMSSVVLMLGSGTEVIPHPKPPGYFVQRSSLETDSPSSKQPDEESCTVNQITLSVIDGR